ncbi:hypothetical protein pah_c022o177 [Parachlamydia acanthamoebae str. Hall's coccus]|jgi:hypothetical protein|nr:hypothetical protein pah_c022o177 [Parachlamydia acanthamoebae str. Hall's coccus]
MCKINTDNKMPLHSDLIELLEKFYKPLEYVCKDIVIENEGQEYGAATCILNGKRIKFRVGKTTPTKIGQFVTFWKRPDGPTLPHDLEDPFDLLIIATRNQSQLGQFIFPKFILSERGILSKNHMGGKRGFRIYPSWDTVNNSQARLTQIWQSSYFFSDADCSKIDRTQIEKLFLF